MSNRVIECTTMLLLLGVTSQVIAQTAVAASRTAESSSSLGPALQGHPLLEAAVREGTHLGIDASPSTMAQPGSWEKVDMVSSGKPLIVTLKVGERIDGTFKASDPGTVVVIDRNRGERHIPKSAVEKIVSAERIRDSLGNGATIGAGIGLGVALGILAVVAASGGEGSYVLPSAKFVAPVLGVGVGLGVGLAIDARHQSTETLYQAFE